MIKFTKQEIYWIKEELIRTVADYNNLENITDEDYKCCLKNYDVKTINRVEKIISVNAFTEINKNKEVQGEIINLIEDIEGYFTWTDIYFTAEEVAEFVSDKMYCSVYKKIYDAKDKCLGEIEC